VADILAPIGAQESPALVDYRAQANQGDDGDIDIEKQRKECVELVEKGLDLLKKTSLDQACSIMSNSPEFVKGEKYIYLFDLQGTCLMHGQDEHLIWRNIAELKDRYDKSIMENVLSMAKMGGGWTTYRWRNATKNTYVRTVEKEGKTYVIGTGFYPHSKRASVESMVKSAVALFDDAMKRGETASSVFSLLGYQAGPYVFGDLYFFALDFDGKIVVQGDLPDLVGKSAWDAADEEGKKINQLIIKELQQRQEHEGVWIDYKSKRALKRTYAEKVVDNKGKQYFIACGYYPEVDRKSVIDLVRQAFRYLKSQGLSEAVKAFNTDRLFRYGNLSVQLFTMKGICLANGEHPRLVGNDFYNERDEDGKYYMQAIIRKAEEGPGWVDYKERNVFKSVYVEKVQLSNESYIITSGLYPTSKRESTILLVKTAIDYFKDHTREEALRKFVEREGPFIRGDLGIFVLDFNGLCLAYNDDNNLIWKNLIDVKDDDGKAFIRLFINTVKSGPGQVSFKLNNATKIAYIESVEKDGRAYVIGSSYYR
jgi:signal transduction histidine kinase